MVLRGISWLYEKKYERDPGSNPDLNRIPIFLPYHYITTPTRQNTEKFKYIN